jgi:cellulose synthase (UDP-forming)
VRAQTRNETGEFGGEPQSGLVIPAPPTDEEKASYAWQSQPFLATCLTLSALCVVVAQAWMEVNYPVAIPFAIYTVTYFLYQAVSIPVNFAGRNFDLTAHELRSMTWQPRRYPDVDIFLPIRGEPIEVLRNTWTGIAELRAAYRGKARPYVLDDGDSDEARRLAAYFGFGYIRRPDHAHQKSGNLNYAFARTDGEHIVIFDADFRPRRDFLDETLPYLDDPQVGIVQTPQFFRVTAGQAWVERAAGATLEVFYRSVQQSRDRFGSALCAGSSAVYRRAALAPSGGFALIPYAEAARTGLDMRDHGYQLHYLPVPLAAGVCPATIDLFVRQQYRWCRAATSLIGTERMWRVPMPARSRLPYLAGWLGNLTAALRTVLLPLIPVVLLAGLPGEVQPRNALLLIPTLVTGTVLYPLWRNAPWPLGTWPLAIAGGWARALALWDHSRGKAGSGPSSRDPKAEARRFRKAALAWNGTLALAWVALAAYRIAATGESRFAIVALMGLINVVVVARIIIPGKNA